MTLLAPTLQSFFTSYLVGQRAASTNTITAYRDTWRLLLTYLRDSQKLSPAKTDLADLSAETIIAFLTHLEEDRGNSPATRNARLAGIHSLFRYAAYALPVACGSDCARAGHRAEEHNPTRHQLPHRC